MSQLEAGGLGPEGRKKGETQAVEEAEEEEV